MLSGSVFYHGLIRKTIVSFGALFSSIYIDRKQGDSVTGTTVQRLQVPISYAPKEKWLVRTDSDPDLTQSTYTTLPRMSFEITGYSYDTSRKLNRNNTITCGKSNGTVSYVQSPVPYNIDIKLYVVTKTQEDAFQIIEQILPTFSPEYTLSLGIIPSMSITQDVPVVLRDISVNDEYDGSFQERRLVTHTLSFTLKMNLYGIVTNTGTGIIETVIANVSTRSDGAIEETYTANGNSSTGVITNEGWESTL